ncbi:virulence factor [Sphingobium sp. JS3065]|uniref:AcvB/VirJ family lysyl-phosphatidylglycerol hydrolase n=1 Tax=Sphingobium sp. JS3065 TaxID=2970925 RepID=UPI00226439F8|nr:AcvB/VirJ family lysyl-phosphatidylglycerol hydrolase [Sphingobium sp. JS3065]UZW57349.1 virulence factor [Sphingobium sp. JS3065]
MKLVASTMLLLCGAILLCFCYLGYLGGHLFDIMPAKAGQKADRHAVALFLSGDMGFHAGLGPAIADRLTIDGIPVVAINSLHFFRIRRTPEQTGAMIAVGLRRAIAIDPEARLLLLGQSFGADVIAPSLPYVPNALRRRIAFVGLIVPGGTREWRASPSEMFSIGEPQEDASLAGRRLSWVPLLCIHGADERSSLCPSLHQRNAISVRLPGGHALHHDADTASAILLRAIDRTLASPAHPT